MLTRLLAAIGLICAASASHAQPVNAFTQGASGGPPYVAGPGDIASGWSLWAGLRGFSAATAAAHANAVILCTGTSSDTWCETETLNTQGGLALGANGATCNNTTVICTIKEFFDQTGNGHHWITTAIANRWTYKTGCIGAFPCATSIANNPSGYNVAVTGIAQPVSLIYAMERTCNTGGPAGVAIGTFTSVPQINGGFDTPNNISMYAGIAADVPAADNVMHAVQTIYNNSVQSLMYLDGAATNVTVGVGPTGPSISWGNSPSGGANFCGSALEAGVLPSAPNSTVQAALNANMHTYWGF